MSMSRTSSPTLRCSFAICSSLAASSSFGRARRAFSPAAKNCSFQRSISAIVKPCLRAASAAEVSPLTMLITTAALRLVVQRCTSSGTSVMTATSFTLIMNAH